MPDQEEPSSSMRSELPKSVTRRGLLLKVLAQSCFLKLLGATSPAGTTIESEALVAEQFLCSYWRQHLCEEDLMSSFSRRSGIRSWNE